MAAGPCRRRARAGDPHNFRAASRLTGFAVAHRVRDGRGPRNRESDEHRDARAAFYRILVKYTITSDKNLL